MWVCYDTHFPTLSLWDGKKFSTLMEGAVLPTVHVNVISKNWHLCGLFWEECKRKKLHVPTSPDIVSTITSFLKTSRGE